MAKTDGFRQTPLNECFVHFPLDFFGEVCYNIIVIWYYCLRELMGYCKRPDVRNHRRHGSTDPAAVAGEQRLQKNEVNIVKKDIHPVLYKTTITCHCGNVIETQSTKENIKVEICSKCHPFYTGKQKLVDTGGRVDRFKKRFNLDK